MMIANPQITNFNPSAKKLVDVKEKKENQKINKTEFNKAQPASYFEQNNRQLNFGGEIGPGSYDAQPIYPRTQSPDLMRSIGRTDHLDLGVGPCQYSPKKEVVLYESPKWTIGEKRPEKEPD